MIYFEPCLDFTPLSAEGRKRAEESVKVWRVQYGSQNGSVDHTLAYFGLISINAVCARGVLWAELTDEGLRAPPSAIKEGREAWREFAASTRWTLHAFANSEVTTSCRFLRFLGFDLIAEDREHKLYEVLK